MGNELIELAYKGMSSAGFYEPPPAGCITLSTDPHTKRNTRTCPHGTHAPRPELVDIASYSSRF